MQLSVISRAECDLCDEMLDELARLASSCELPPIEVLDVDSDPLLTRRYGLKVPVLLLDGALVCQHRLDQAELRRLLKAGNVTRAALP